MGRRGGSPQHVVRQRGERFAGEWEREEGQREEWEQGEEQREGWQQGEERARVLQQRGGPHELAPARGNGASGAAYVTVKEDKQWEKQHTGGLSGNCHSTTS